MLITFLCFSAISPMMAQDVKGKIVDEKGQPLAFANVVLLNRQDSAFVKGVVSGEDGHFAIDSPCNNGIIKVTSVGYKTVWKDCAGENAGVIKMMADSKMLGEVVVKSSMPKTILKNGGMTTSPDEKDLQQMTYLDKLTSCCCSDYVSLSDTEEQRQCLGCCNQEDTCTNHHHNLLLDILLI